MKFGKNFNSYYKKIITNYYYYNSIHLFLQNIIKKEIYIYNSFICFNNGKFCGISHLPK